MSFLSIDRIIRLEASRQIVALKNVALSDEVFRDHFVGCPIMPGSLLIECLAQAASALLELSSGLSAYPDIEIALRVVRAHAR